MTLHERFKKAKLSLKYANFGDTNKKSDIDELVMYAYFLGRSRATKDCMEHLQSELDYCTTFVKSLAKKEAFDEI